MFYFLQEFHHLKDRFAPGTAPAKGGNGTEVAFKFASAGGFQIIFDYLGRGIKELLVDDRVIILGGGTPIFFL